MDSPTPPVPRHDLSSCLVPLSDQFQNRIRAAYKAALAAGPVPLDPLWSMIAAKTQDIHEALISGEESARYLDMAAENYLNFGFDSIFRDWTLDARRDSAFREHVTSGLHHELALLAEAVGAKRKWNPEGGAKFPDKAKPAIAGVDDLIAQIEDRIGFQLTFPNPLPNEFGLIARAGLISQRTIHAVYQAWRVKHLTDEFGGRVVELGAGLGRTAFYAVAFGVKSYTIVDIPMSTVAQANFLGRVLGEDRISLPGEVNDAAVVRIQSTDWLDKARDSFDVLLNADSLTEMTTDVADHYMAAFKRRGRAFLSINHEANLDTVSGIASLDGLRRMRAPYWLREGYIEELFVTKRQRGLASKVLGRWRGRET